MVLQCERVLHRSMKFKNCDLSQCKLEEAHTQSFAKPVAAISSQAKLSQQISNWTFAVNHLLRKLKREFEMFKSNK